MPEPVSNCAVLTVTVQTDSCAVVTDVAMSVQMLNRKVISRL